jgi:PKD repeat protein
VGFGKRTGTLVALLATAALLGAPSASGDTVNVSDPVFRDCTTALPAGTSGTAHRTWSAPDRGLLSARLRGPADGDWDVAILSGTRVIAASAAGGATELATAFVEAGDAVSIQACRLDGPGGSAQLELRHQPVRTDLPAPRISLESVAIGGPADLSRLEGLGFDVTHDVDEDSVSVVLYGDGDRERLAREGFASTTLIADLVAADAAARAAEDRVEVRSPLPSGRDEYRQYVDFTTEMRALAQANPSLVRSITLGTSLEGRPIEGVEIATDVLRSDDGRPVFLNLGGHHAREWPSAEFPMEFALDLVSAATDPGHPMHTRVLALLSEVRIVTVPVVNVDGFIASRSHGTSPADDDPTLTAPFSGSGIGAYRRKNCRPLNPTDAATPCAMRGSSGVDLNRNYGYWWGGPGSSATPTSQSYRGTGPFSEPESEAVHQFSSRIHPTVVISNHTFTEEGWWLRQPGFNAPFFPQGPTGEPSIPVGAITPDEPALKALGDAMGDGGTDDPTSPLGATGWPSDLAWLLGDITGATEDWNYFAQGAYGYTPEARGPNFHANYAQMVVQEYLGDEFHVGEGVREAFMLAAEEAADPADHSTVSGDAPPGATLRLRKEFTSPSHPNAPGAPTTPEVLNTTLEVGASGEYEWHVNPSSRPDIDSGPGQNPPPETWTMTCERPGQGTFGPVQVDVARGGTAGVDWAGTCGVDPPTNAPPVAAFDVTPLQPLQGQQVNFISTSDDPDGAIATTEWDLDGDGQFDDATGLAASHAFTAPGDFSVSLRVTDEDDGTDIETRTVHVIPVDGGPVPPKPEPPSGVCRRKAATIVGTAAAERIRGTDGADVIAALGGADRINAGAGKDIVCGGAGKDRIKGGLGADTLLGNTGADLLFGAKGRDFCAGGSGRDRTRSCP